MGDGSRHNLDANWTYPYTTTEMLGEWWNSSLGLTVFAYYYDNAQWWDHGNCGGRQLLGSTGVSGASYLGPVYR
ncbi:MAG TPA: hypothetical protein VMC85_07925 [Desulfomonilaceae bacterium]|nr:hypothetical protein [Desulfomonilaceae bacterium]